MSGLPRTIEPEWLDSLPHHDPLAIRGRRDLRRINFMMGNHRWVLRQVARHPESARRGIVELGSGEGELLEKLARHGPATGCDLAPRPSRLPAAIDWLEGDLFAHAETISGGILVANLFLHHFPEPDLERIGAIAERFETLLLVEPHRTRKALALAQMLLPVFSRATRHDMPASIHAGFAEGDLQESLGLSPVWNVKELRSWRGGLRLLATRAP